MTQAIYIYIYILYTYICVYIYISQSMSTRRESDMMGNYLIKGNCNFLNFPGPIRFFLDFFFPFNHFLILSFLSFFFIFFFFHSCLEWFSSTHLGLVWSLISNSHFYNLNNITHISIHFFTNTYFKKL